MIGLGYKTFHQRSDILAIGIQRLDFPSWLAIRIVTASVNVWSYLDVPFRLHLQNLMSVQVGFPFHQFLIYCISYYPSCSTCCVLFCVLVFIRAILLWYPLTWHIYIVYNILSLNIASIYIMDTYTFWSA